MLPRSKVRFSARSQRQGWVLHLSVSLSAIIAIAVLCAAVSAFAQTQTSRSRKIYCGRRGEVRTVPHAGRQQWRGGTESLAAGRTRPMAAGEDRFELAADSSTDWRHSITRQRRGHDQVTDDGDLDHGYLSPASNAAVSNEPRGCGSRGCVFEIGDSATVVSAEPLYRSQSSNSMPRSVFSSRYFTMTGV